MSNRGGNTAAEKAGVQVQGAQWSTYEGLGEGGQT